MTGLKNCHPNIPKCRRPARSWVFHETDRQQWQNQRGSKQKSQQGTIRVVGQDGDQHHDLCFGHRAIWCFGLNCQRMVVVTWHSPKAANVICPVVSGRHVLIAINTLQNLMQTESPTKGVMINKADWTWNIGANLDILHMYTEIESHFGLIWDLCGL